MQGIEKILTFYKKELSVSDYSVYIDEDIDEPSYYRELCETLINASPDDTFKFYFSSNGGRADGMMSLLFAMKQTPARTFGVLVGDAISAASALFLACDSHVVNESGRMMIHTAFHGFQGKNNDFISYYESQKEWIDKFLGDNYGDFLSLSEMEYVKRGNDLYLNANQVEEKLVAMYEKKEADANKLCCEPEIEEEFH